MTGRTFLSRSRECLASSHGTPGMSEGFHAKMSLLAQRKEVSASSYAESRLAPIKAILCGSSSLKTMVFIWTPGVSCNSDAESFVGSDVDPLVGSLLPEQQESSSWNVPGCQRA